MNFLALNTSGRHLGLKSIARLDEVAHRHGHRMTFIRPVELTLEIGAHLPLEADAVLTRLGSGTSAEDMLVLRAVADTGIPILNGPDGLEQCRSKGSMLIRLQAHGIPVPQSFVVSTADPAGALFAPAVIKTMRGSQGDGVMLCESIDQVKQAIGLARRCGAEQILMQRVVPGCHGVDWRILVLDGAVIGAIERRAEGFRSNVAQGGQTTQINISDEVCHLAIAAAAALNLDFAGVDILPSSQGRLCARSTRHRGLRASSAPPALTWRRGSYSGSPAWAAGAPRPQAGLRLRVRETSWRRAKRG